MGKPIRGNISLHHSKIKKVLGRNACLTGMVCGGGRTPPSGMMRSSLMYMRLGEGTAGEKAFPDCVPSSSSVRKPTRQWRFPLRNQGTSLHLSWQTNIPTRPFESILSRPCQGPGRRVEGEDWGGGGRNSHHDLY